MFVIKRISSEEPNLSLDMPNLEYAIPTREQLTNWVQQGYDCDTADADTLHSALTYFTFKPWSKGGSEFPRVAYINNQSAWNTWLTKFKAVHPEAANGGGSNSPILNQWVIDSYTFIIGCSGDIDFATDSDTYDFLNCTIINNDITGETTVLNFVDCMFRNCHLYSECSIIGGGFNNCSLLIDADITNASINDCDLHGSGSTYYCNIRRSDVKISAIEDGIVEYSDIQQCDISNYEINACRLYNCAIYSAKFTSNFIEMIGCSTSTENAFRTSVNEIKGFIFGCDFSSLAGIPGSMHGVLCCKLQSTLLSSGAIKADLFGRKSAASNGLNTGV